MTNATSSFGVQVIGMAIVHAGSRCSSSTGRSPVIGVDITEVAMSGSNRATTGAASKPIREAPIWAIGIVRSATSGDTLQPHWRISQLLSTLRGRHVYNGQSTRHGSVPSTA